MSDAGQNAIGVAELKRQLTIEELDTDLYRGTGSSQTPGRAFGGQVIAQALAAATSSISDERAAHSLHGYFLRAGDNTKPIIYRVIRDFDGSSFANRRVVAMQDGKPILNLAASFQSPESGLSHSAPMPLLPGPQDAVPMAAILKQLGSKVPRVMVERLACFQIRISLPDRQSTRPSGIPGQHSWFQLDPELGPDLARIALAYLSDFGLISTAMLPHEVEWFTPEIQGASLDHAIWFHEHPPLGEWLLYAMESPWSGHARGFSRGSVFDRSGRLIASMTQEGLMRYRPRA